MEQAEAVHHARRMTEAVATFSQNQGVAPETSRMEEFHNAAFSQAFEFIPNGAVATVITITEDEGLPMLVAVHGQQLYKLVFGEFDLRGDESPPTLCEMLNLAPENCTVIIETLYAAAAPPGRATRIADWNFHIGSKGFRMQTRFSPDQENEGETFAQALAGAMGWGELASAR